MNDLGSENRLYFLIVNIENKKAHFKAIEEELEKRATKLLTKVNKL